MSPNVAVGQFEGPLGLLLDLVERNQLEVTSISVADITTQYLERVHGLEVLEPYDLSEFLRLGARLLYIKSLALLPSDTAPADPTEELRQLNIELADYRIIQAAARALATRSTRRSWERPVAEKLPLEDRPLPSFELNSLRAAFEQVLRHAPSPARLPEQHLPLKRLRLDEAIGKLRLRLSDGFELPALIGPDTDRLEAIVTFLALLELIREGAAQVQQPEPFGSLRVEAAA